MALSESVRAYFQREFGDLRVCDCDTPGYRNPIVYGGKNIMQIDKENSALIDTIAVPTIPRKKS